MNMIDRYDGWMVEWVVYVSIKGVRGKEFMYFSF